jgi:polysaccharide export outer membrane protein
MRITLAAVLSIQILSGACSGGRQLTENGQQFIEAQAVVVPGDIIHLEMTYYPSFNQSMIVQPGGLLHVGGLGPVQVGGMTITELEQLLTRRFSDMLALPELSIRFQESIDVSFYVAGAVHRPGMVRFRKNITLLQGIALAGGLKGKDSHYEIVIFRKSNDSGVQMYKMSIGQDEVSSRTAFKLQPLDVVFVMHMMPTRKKEFRI